MPLNIPHTNVIKMAYFDRELKTALFFAVVGAVVGYISFLLNNPARALIVAIVVYVVLYIAMKKIGKVQEGGKWWVGNAVIVYVLMWFVIWTLLFNTVVL